MKGVPIQAIKSQGLIKNQPLSSVMQSVERMLIDQPELDDHE
jgi:hypothetical protein